MLFSSLNYQSLGAQHLEQLSLGGAAQQAKGLKCLQAFIGQESLKLVCESVIRTGELEAASCQGYHL